MAESSARCHLTHLVLSLLHAGPREVVFRLCRVWGVGSEFREDTSMALRVVLALIQINKDQIVKLLRDIRMIGAEYLKVRVTDTEHITFTIRANAGIF